MLVQVDDVKSYLGLPLEANPTVDPVLERSVLLAETLVGSYVGFRLEQDMSAQLTLTKHYITATKVVRLPHFPVKVSSVKLDDTVLAADQYRIDERLGLFEFAEERTSVGKLEIKYSPGFSAETFPPDIRAAVENIAIGIYENGGKIAVASSSGALKSLTMFDAMSMSFDTGSTAASAGTPEGIVSQWAFVLDKYKVNSFVTA
jgi:hypothetical protein